METLRITFAFELGPLADGSYYGGIENHIMNLMSELTKLGHECTLLTGSIPNAPATSLVNFNGLQAKVMRVDCCKMISSAWNPFNLRFKREFWFMVHNLIHGLTSRPSWDIIHGHVYSSGLSAYFLGKLAKTPAINTIHGSYYDFWSEIETPGSHASLVFRPMERVLAPFLANRCDRQIHTDYYFANKVISWGVNPQKVTTIHNGVNDSIFTLKAQPVDYIDTDHTIITVRRLVRKNGIHNLIEAMKYLDPTIKLAIVGDGPEKANLVNLSTNLHLDHRVSFLGRKPNIEVPSLLQAAKLVAIPSIIEASSISLIEAMLMKRPTVVTRIPGIVEISTNETTTQVKPNDPRALAKGISSVLADYESMAKNKAEKAYNYAKANFTSARVAKQHLKVYKEELLKKR